MSDNKLYKNKMGMFDFIKGIAIFAVILCHTVECWKDDPICNILVVSNSVIGACWMPLFFMSSAYWYKKRPVKAYIKSQMSNLIIPFLRMEVVAWICYGIISYIKWRDAHGALMGIRGLMLGAATGSMTEVVVKGIRIGNVGPMWFVVSLFFTSIIFNWIMNQDKIKDKKAVIIFITLVGVLFGKFKWQPYCFSAAFAALLSYYIGYQLKNTGFLLRKWTRKECIFIAGIIVGSYLSVGFLSRMELYCNAVYITFGIPMGIVAMRLGLIIGKRGDNAFTLFVKKMGRYTFWILMVHTIEVFSIDWNWFKNWHVLSGFAPIVQFVIVLIIRLCLDAFGCYVLAKLSKLYMRIKGNGVSNRVA